MLLVEKRILIKVSSMYYLDHLKQSEIAKRMGVDRTTISKYLKRAQENGIVRITVESNSYEELEAALEKRFSCGRCTLSNPATTFRPSRRTWRGRG